MTPKIQFDFTSIDPRWRAIIIGGVVIIVLAIAGLIFLKPGRGDAVADVTITPTVSPTPTLPSTPTFAGPPSETPLPLPTATFAPYEYTIEAGDTLYAIIQIFGYRDLQVVPEVIALNGMRDENDLIAGNKILIPRQTPTIGPTFTATSTLDPLITPSVTPTPGPTLDLSTVSEDDCTPANRCPSSDGQFWIHIVRAGDTIANIAFRYNTRLDCIEQANNLFGDNPVIVEGQQIKVCILVTQTPTLTPTGGPDSTATPLPTPSAPSLIAPAQNASITRNQDVTLQWAASRPLANGQSYLVLVKNTASGEETKFTTRTNAFKLPDSLRPGTGQTIIYEWRVLIVSGSTPESQIVSGTGQPYTFQWGQ